MLYKCRELGRKHVNLTEIKSALSKLLDIEQLKLALKVNLLHRARLAAKQIRDWQKKINRNEDIQNLKQTPRSKSGGGAALGRKYRNGALASSPLYASVRRKICRQKLRFPFQYCRSMNSTGTMPCTPYLARTQYEKFTYFWRRRRHIYFSFWIDSIVY